MQEQQIKSYEKIEDNPFDLDETKQESIYGKFDDSCRLLKGTKMLLSSFSVYGIFGIKNTGKTTKQNQIVDEYVRINKQNNQYDLDNPLIIQNAPITDIFELSPTVDVDKSTVYNKNNDKVFINLNPENLDIKQDGNNKLNKKAQITSTTIMEEFLKQIFKLQKNMTNIIKLQCQIRYIMKNVDDKFYNNVEFLPLIQNLFQMCLVLDQFKNDYPQYQFKETNKKVLQNMKNLYKIFNQKFDGYFVRSHSIIIQIDDASGMSFMSGTTVNNAFYQFINQTRHYGIYSLLINAHSLTALFGQFREALTCIILCNGLNEDHIQTLYKNLLKGKQKFQYKDFLLKYQEHMGYNDTKEDTGQYNYRFIYIMRAPVERIFKDWTESIL